MKTNFFNRFSALINHRRTGFRRKAFIFSFFLIVAVIIWFLKALEKNYTTQIDYPVRYRNFPNDKTLVGELPDHLKLNVYAHGYVLLQHKISSRYIPLVISVNSFSLKQLRGQDSGFYFLETRFLKDYVSKQLSSEFEILEISPDSLFFPFAEVIEKKLPVRAAFDFQPDKQMIIRFGPVIIPDSVFVTGPDYILDTLKYVNTREKDFGVLSGDRKLDVQLKPIRHSTLKPQKVEVKIEMEKFTEKTLYVPLRVEGVPDSLQVVTFPREISLSCQVGLTNYERVQPGSFKLSVEYSDIAEGRESLNVKLSSAPDYVRSVEYTPKTVEYLIQK